VKGAAKFDSNITFASTQTFPGATGTQGPQGPPGPAGVSFWTSNSQLQPFTDSVKQYGAVMGISNATTDNDDVAVSRVSLIFPTACNASNLAVNLGFVSIVSPFDMTTTLLVNDKATPLTCDTGFDFTNNALGFSCSSTGTYAISAGSQVALQFSHTGTDPSNIFPTVAFNCN
jgi:hypothetical protein